MMSCSKSPAARFGKNDGFSWAVRVDGIDNDFFRLPFGRRLEDQRKARKLKDNPAAKTIHVGAKGKSTLAAVKKWAKETKPKQFYASWKSDGPLWKDDSVQVVYVP